MPWTIADPPPCAVNWTDDEKRKCVAAANSRMAQGGDNAEQEAVFACIHAAGKGETMADELKATWATALVNTFPDSSFLFIESGGEKDEDGKTKPRSLRHFPYRNAEGGIDLPHLRNAIARIPQSNAPGLTPDKKEALQRKAQAMLEKENAKQGGKRSLGGWAFEDLLAAFSDDPDAGEPATKIGARHSMKDGEYVQRIHDDAVDLGAECKARPKEEPAAEAKATYAVKTLGENRIGGYGVLFGSEDQPDLSEQKDFFTKATDFFLDKLGPIRPMLYHHAQEEATAMIPVVGLWDKAVQDDVGVWLEGELDKAHRYRKAIGELVAKGALALSSDSAPHLVLREKAGKGTHRITRWPLFCCSLTPTPAEPRLAPVDFETIKAAYKAVGIALPVSVEDAQSAQDDSAKVLAGDAGKSATEITERVAILKRLLDIATS